MSKATFGKHGDRGSWVGSLYLFGGRTLELVVLLLCNDCSPVGRVSVEGKGNG